MDVYIEMQSIANNVDAVYRITALPPSNFDVPVKNIASQRRHRTSALHHHTSALTIAVWCTNIIIEIAYM